MPSTLSSTCLWIIVFVIVALLFIMLRQPKSGYNRGGAGGMTLFVDLEGQKHVVDVAPDATAKDLLVQLANQLGRINPARRCGWTNQHSCPIFGNHVGTSGKHARDDGTPNFAECCRNRLFYGYQLEFGGQPVPLSATLASFGIPAEATLSLNIYRPGPFKIIVKSQYKWVHDMGGQMKLIDLSVGTDAVLTLVQNHRLNKVDDQTLVSDIKYDKYRFILGKGDGVDVRTFLSASPENHRFIEGLRSMHQTDGEGGWGEYEFNVKQIK